MITAEQVEQWRDEGVDALDIVGRACRPGALAEEQATAWLDVIVTRDMRSHAMHYGVLGVEAWAARWLAGEDRPEASAVVVELEQQVRDLLGVLMSDEAGGAA